MPWSWLVGRAAAAVVDAVAVEDDVVRRAPVERADREADARVAVGDVVAGERDAVSVHRRARQVAGVTPVEREVGDDHVVRALRDVQSSDDRRLPAGSAGQLDRRAGLPAVVDAEALVVVAGSQAAGLAGREAVHQLLCRAVRSGARARGRVASARGGEAVARDRGRGRRSADPENRGAEEKRGCGDQHATHVVGIGHRAADRSLERGNPAERAAAGRPGRAARLELARSDDGHRLSRTARRRGGRGGAARPDPRAVPDLPQHHRQRSEADVRVDRRADPARGD